MMKMLRSLMIAFVLGVSVSAAQAHDAFNVGISFGGHANSGAPVVAYQSALPVVYYNVPRVYYPAPHVYYRAPLIGYRDLHDGAPRHYFSGHRHHGSFGLRGHGYRGHAHRGQHR